MAKPHAVPAGKGDSTAPRTASSPTSAEVEAHILRVARRYPRWVRVEAVTETIRHRPIYAVTVTDDRTPDADKQHVLVVAGQHGSEESPRRVALALLDWLVSGAGAETRRKQKISIMPNVNPDGAEQDTYGTPEGVLPNLDHGPDGARSPEGRAVERIAYALQPEVFVDMHARGNAGCSFDMVLFPWTRPYTEDGNLFHAIAAEMASAGEQAGIPQVVHPLTWPGWGGDKPTSEASTTLFAYRNFKSIVMLTENSESNLHAYPVALTARSGLAKMLALLRWGNRRHPKLFWSGYPNMLVSKHFSGGVLAWGATARQRRRSRIALWKHIGHFKKFGQDGPEAPKSKKLLIEYAGPALNDGIAFQLGLAGRVRVKSVRWDGTPLRRSTTHGYCQFGDAHNTYVMAAFEKLRPGKHELEVRL